MKKMLLVAALSAAYGVFPALAGATNHGSSQAVSTEQQPLTDGEVRKVDKEAKKLTIRHGPITNLDMPAMTMVFQVKDPAMLDSVKAGDKVRFVADKAGGAYTVTKIEPAK
jgi:Cu(I)/Ag(I) efflux system protein CusF